MANKNESLIAKSPNSQDKYYAFVYFLSYITLGLSTATLGPMLVQIAGVVNEPLTAVSILFGLKSMGYFIGSVGGGKLYDRIKGHILQVISISLMAFFMFLIPITSNLAWMGVIMFFLGTMEGLLDVGGNTLLVWRFKDNVAPYMNGLHFFFGLGAFLAPMIIAYIIPFENAFRWSYWVLGMLFIPSIIGFLLIKSPNQILEGNTYDKRKPYSPVLILIILLFFTYVGTELSFGSWLSSYASLSKFATEVQAAILTSIFWGAFTGGRLLGVILSKWIKPFTFLVVDIIGSIISLLCLIFLAKDLNNLIIFTVLLGFFLSSVFPMLIVFAKKKVQITGAMTGLFFLGASSGGMLFPFILTGLFTFYGYRVIPVALLVSSGLSLLILFGIYILRNNKKGEI